MDTATKWHLSGGLIAAIVSGLTWWFAWPAWVANVLLVTTNLYLLAILVEAGNRSAKERTIEEGVLKAKPKWKMEFPARTWSILQVAFLIFIIVSGFAALYIDSGQVLIQNTTALTDKCDALYYSIVTMTTLGYGDMTPSGASGRLLVMWQLGTGTLLLVGIFPLVVARVSDF